MAEKLAAAFAALCRWLEAAAESKPLTQEQEKNINDQADRCW